MNSTASEPGLSQLCFGLLQLNATDDDEVDSLIKEAEDSDEEQDDDDDDDDILPFQRRETGMQIASLAVTFADT